MLKFLFSGVVSALIMANIGLGASVSFSGVANGVFSSGVNSSNVVLTGGNVDPHYTLIQLPAGCAGTAACSEDGTLGNSFGPASYTLLNGYPNDGTWSTPAAGSAWIGPRADQTNPVVGAPITSFPNIGIFASDTDFYVFRMVFNLTTLGLDSAGAIIDLNWISDNRNTSDGALNSHIRLCSVATASSPVCGAGSDITNAAVGGTVNGGNLGQSSPVTAAGNRVIINSGFSGGLMALDFIVYNSSIAFGKNPSGLDVVINSATSNALSAGTLSSVPEPATFSLIAAALVGVGLLRRRN